MSPSFDYSVAMNFGWLEQDRIAGCRGPRSDNDLAFLASKRIKALVRLAHEEETGIFTADVDANGIEDCYEPVPDRTAPSQDQIDRIMSFVRNAIEKGRPIAVSCGAGCGRTGTVLACYLVSAGHSAEDAIQKLLAVRPCSREILVVPGQREAVLEFERRLKQGLTPKAV